MTPADERHAFSERLRSALDAAGWRSIGATALAREFNARAKCAPVTVHATRKWLLGDAIPAQDNLQEIARWLEVSAHWLRFGEGAAFGAAGARLPLKTAEPAASPYAAERAARLAADFARLDAEQQAVVEELVAVLLKRKKNPKSPRGG
ncbi:hypothetical protein [Variovorax sp. OV329]|uniref:hypothetical protein n=1 Tax=Variovorax sp. OV329 TaxID=1882825 RepID=UPI0008E922EC|nr:hypothetical protein [Variovorax sp. OV329]SFM31205.1 hypothetical protein SAMN05444747_104230 [Variovorax sp. OV329]